MVAESIPIISGAWYPTLVARDIDIRVTLHPHQIHSTDGHAFVLAATADFPSLYLLETRIPILEYVCAMSLRVSRQSTC